MDDEFRAKKITPFINGRKIIDLGGVLQMYINILKNYFLKLLV